MTGICRYATEKNNSLLLASEIINLFKYQRPTTTNSFFTEILPRTDNSSVLSVLLEASEEIDPFQNEDWQNNRIFTTTGETPTPRQKWRILLVAKKSSQDPNIVNDFRVYWGTPEQLRNTTDILYGTPELVFWSPGFEPTPFRNTYSYRAVINRKGFAIAMWRNNKVNELAPGNTLLCIQRPVQPGGGDAGQVRESGRIPLFVLDIQYGRSRGEEIMYNVLREEDINTPSPKRNIGKPSYFNMYGFNLGWLHPNILSNTTHAIKVPFGLATERHLYMEEMDLISFTQATSFIVDQPAELTMYGKPRKYVGTFGLVDYGYENTYQILGGSRINLLYAIDPAVSGSETITDISDVTL
jgi:hypothetical protein